jgi:hypothetical protein
LCSKTIWNYFLLGNKIREVLAIDSGHKKSWMLDFVIKNISEVAIIGIQNIIQESVMFSDKNSDLGLLR